MSGYHSIRAVSRGSLMKFRESPEEYFAIYVQGEMDDFEETDSILRGTVAHAAFEDMNSLRDRFAIIPSDIPRRDMRIAKWRDFVAQCKAENKSPVKPEDIERSVRTAEALKVALRDALNSAVKVESEVVCLWSEPDILIDCKAMLDLKITFANNDVLIVDIKTSDERPSLRKFGRSARSFGYWMQDVHYSRGFEVLNPEQRLVDFVFASIQTQGRYPCRLFRFDSETRREAHEERMMLLEDLRRRMYEGDWKDSDHDVITDVSLSLRD